MYKRKSFVIVFVLTVLVGFSSRSFCAEDSISRRRSPIVEVYEKTRDTVVNISGMRMVSTSGMGGYSWPGMFDFLGPSWGPRYRQEISVLGSGVVVHEDGYVVTNAHVVEEAESIKIIFNNGDEFSGKLIQADESKDLALLKIEADKKLPFVHLGRSDDLLIGETVVAIGNPYGYSNTLTTGVISAEGRDIQVSEDSWLRGLIQTDAPINPGNSGGPLFNINGDLIGINTAIAEGAENIGFSIPVDTLADNLRQMLMPEKLRRVRLGLNVGRIQAAGEQKGLFVDSVTPSSPADDAGLLQGDIILAVDGQKLKNIIDFYITMMGKDIGEPITIEYIRPDVSTLSSRQVKLSILERPLPDGRELVRKFFQMDVSELNDRVASELGFASAYPVLIITDIENNGAVDNIGLSTGDIILGIDGATIRDVTELSLAMEKINENDIVEMAIMRIFVNNFRQVQRRYTIRLRAQSNR